MSIKDTLEALKQNALKGAEERALLDALHDAEFQMMMAMYGPMLKNLPGKSDKKLK